MLNTNKILAVFMLMLTLLACHEDIDDNINPSSTAEINDFVWKGMNVFYLYKSDIPDLADDRFSNNQEYTDYLNSFESPESLFNSVLRDDDRFSVIVSDFRALENSIDGITLDSGMRFGLVLIESTGDVFGYVRYVVENSPADNQGVERGMLFNRINGEVFSENTNFGALFNQENFTIGLANLNGNSLESSDQTIDLTQVEITENPIHTTNVIDLGNQKVGYLMYTSFIDDKVNELNSVFGQFAAENITDLVVDLRYNSGGNVSTAEDLSSMITGQFNGELFVNQEFNSNFDDQEILFDNETSSGNGINSLNLNQVYIITTSSTASASALVISALTPYIDVVKVGTTTTGKFQGSITVYDSDDFRRENANLNHKYALQPLVLKTVNANGFTDFVNGLDPDVEQFENFADLGQLGQPEEPLLSTVLSIIGNGRTTPINRTFDYEILGESQMNSPNYQRMYINESSISPQKPLSLK